MIRFIIRKLFDLLDWVIKTAFIIGGIAFIGYLLFKGVGLLIGFVVGGFVHYYLSRE